MVALSGGPDSTALLDLLRRLAGDRDLRLVAAHFDHGVRPGSGAEAERVAGRAREMGVEARVGRAREKPDADHAELRRRRYRFFRRVARREEAGRIATGHQADDQVETVLFRLLRGSGLRGLRGIPERREEIVRPVLGFRARELRSYLNERDLPWLSDPANLDPSYARTRLRHELLPALETVWERDPAERLLRVGREAGRAEERMERLTETVLEACRQDGAASFRVPELTADRREERRLRLDRPCLLAAGRELQARVLRRAARRRGVRVTRGGTREGVEFVNDGRSGGRVALGGGLQLCREFTSFWIGTTERIPEDLPLSVETGSPGRGRLRAGGRRYEAAWGPAIAGESFPHRLAIPRKIRQLSLTLRGWRDGDRIDLPAGRIKLKELFNRRRVPRSERSRLPLLAAGSSRVLWVPGLADALRDAGGEEDENMWWIGVRND